MLTLSKCCCYYLIAKYARTAATGTSEAEQFTSLISQEHICYMVAEQITF
jgi:hypothetical protein